MCPRSLLVITKNPNTKLRCALRGRGFAPVGAPNMQAALRRVREGIVAAILVPRQHPGLDVLEFVLNARDIAPSIPILVGVGTGDTSVDEAIVAVGRAVLLKDCEGPDRLAAEVEQVLAGARAHLTARPPKPEGGAGSK